MLESNGHKNENFLRSGVISGAISALIFTALHQVFISDIWFSTPVMLISGALCGLCLGWSYRSSVAAPNIRNWLAYNLVYISMFAVLGAVSVAMFDPITTVEALIEANESPNELIGKAMPLTIVFTLAAAAIMTLLFNRTIFGFLRVLTTCIVLVITLGLNVSIIGLVSIPGGSFYLVVELFALIFVLGAVFASTFVALERNSLAHR
jgi:hypothetical protein